MMLFYKPYCFLVVCTALKVYIIYILLSSQLMTKEPLEKLGFKDLMDPPSSQTEQDTKP